MITVDAILVLLAAASLPVLYLFMVSRWIETDYRKTYPKATTPEPSAKFVKIGAILSSELRSE